MDVIFVMRVTFFCFVLLCFLVVSCKKVICFLEFNNCVCKFDKNKNKNLLKKYLVNKKKFTGGNNSTHKKVSECGKNIGARLAKYNSQ